MLFRGIHVPSRVKVQFQSPFASCSPSPRTFSSLRPVIASLPRSALFQLFPFLCVIVTCVRGCPPLAQTRSLHHKPHHRPPHAPRPEIFFLLFLHSFPLWISPLPNFSRLFQRTKVHSTRSRFSSSRGQTLLELRVIRYPDQTIFSFSLQPFNLARKEPGARDSIPSFRRNTRPKPTKNLSTDSRAVRRNSIQISRDAQEPK